MRELEQRFEAELVVVGVHSGKFIAERVSANIREAAIRLGLHHPVVNDRQYRIWRAYAVNAWPTLVLVDPRGYVVGQHAGEATADQLAPAIARVVEAATADGSLDRRLLAFPSEPTPDTPLRFPEKVALDPPGSRLAVADTGHDRVLVFRLAPDGASAALETVVGSGETGLADGTFDAARFHRPHGVAFDPDDTRRLFVADTENHAIRLVDLAAGTVLTLAGTGEQARGWPPAGGRGPEVALNSPWDVLLRDGTLYVAMAGRHQVWRLDLGTGRIEPWIGSGAEAIHDGPAAAAALAQPSGLTLSPGEDRLYFADSESSAIRWADRGTGETGTIVGTGLFDFGNRDGRGDEVRLQHPLGVAWHAGEILIADTYNGALKRLDPATREVRTWDVTVDGGLWEPAGLAVAGSRVVVADTNHHRLLAGPMEGDTLTNLELTGF